VALPLLLCGPILRRVEPTLVSVWVALREPATVALRLWEGRVAAGAANMLLSSEPAGTRTLRVGAQLHIALATIKIPKTSPRLLQPGRAYSYDLAITIGNTTHTLKTLGLLTKGQVFGKAMEPLGFEENMLPSFALPPERIEDLRVLFGSCRRPWTDFPDAMVWIDDLMRENPAYSFTDPLRRPHQLFLGGDQIYADDVSPVHLRMLIDLSRALIGESAGAAVERLMVDNVRRKKANVTPTGFDDYDANVTRETGAPADFSLPADHAHFPAGRRFLMTTVDAQMTTVDAWSHLFSLGEFAAMYLTVWSDACWSRTTGATPALDLPTADQLMSESPPWPDRIPTFLDAPLGGKEGRDHGLTKAEREVSPFQNYSVYLEPRADDDRTPEKRAADYQKHRADLKKELDRHRQQLTLLESGLGKVRRALANIPTYMIFDDHDVTDDWNLNPMWYDRIYTTSLGVTTVRNALVSYAVFQDWGNDPLKYEKGNHKRLLELIEGLFPPTETKGPNATAANDIDALFGFGLRGKPDEVDGSVSAVNPPITWHFSVPGPKHLAVALDNRTRRSFLSRNGPPGNVAGSLDRTENTVQTEQIPAGPFTDGKEVLLVIAPLQVLGPPILDELVAPAAFRAFDIKDYGDKLQPGLRSGSRGMAGTNPDAIEAWAFDPKTLEALLRRLEPYRRVVLLSGDVHYSASTVMSYWTKGAAEPARIVQFTSSGFKNVMPSYITAVDRGMAIAHKIVRANLGAERLGWDRKPSNPVLLPAGNTAKDIPRALRARLRLEPTMLPTYGWPKGSTINPAQLPDWSWRVEPVFDLRADAARPPAIQPLVFEVDADPMLEEINAPRALQGYQAASARHQRAVEMLRNSRQILFRSNFGLVRFEMRGDVLHAVHEIYTAARLPEDVGTDPPKPDVFVLHEAALAAPEAVRPERLSLQPIPADSPRVTTAQI
jgi:hypothetical protein